MPSTFQLMIRQWLPLVLPALLTLPGQAGEAAPSLRQRVLQQLREHGSTRIVSASRRAVADGHWYANLGYYAERDNPAGVPGSARLDGCNVAYLPGARLFPSTWPTAPPPICSAIRTAACATRFPIPTDGRSCFPTGRARPPITTCSPSATMAPGCVV